MNIKPRIFIHMHYLEIGGAESALIGLLQSLDPGKVDVDLFLNEHRGEMMRYIPEWVNLLPTKNSYSMIERPMIEAVKKFQFGIVVGRLLAKVRFTVYNKKRQPKDKSAIFGYVGKYVNPFLPFLKKLGKYDLAISFLTPHNIVLRKIEARKKICWIHTDYSSVDINVDLELPVWSGYDNIVSISPAVTESFVNRFPSLAPKIIEIENLLPEVVISERAKEFLPEEYKKESSVLNLLTIGRYCEAKNIDSVPEIARRLLDKGIVLHWFVIGYGDESELEKIKEAIKKNKMEEHVILLGKKENPYPYIKACDWYVQPSRYEGKSIAVREAQLLGKPVIITNYPTAKSQVNHGVDGMIVPLETASCADAMAGILKDNDLKMRLELTEGRSTGLNDTVALFYGLIDEL